jgi:protein-S-isoprenylcysteine O-methyltransferase Ste14
MSFFPKLALVPAGGWILTLLYIIVSVAIPITRKESIQRLVAPQRKPTPTFVEKLKKVTNMITWYGAMLYTVFLPLKTGTIMFYVGIVLFFSGLVLSAISLVNYINTPLDTPVVSGLYKFSRNPIYLFYAITWYGAVLAVSSGLLLLLHTAEVVLCHFSILEEEKDCEEQYGQSYLDFKNRIPRYFGPF